MRVKERGPDWTYRRMDIKNIFEPGNLENELVKIMKTFGKSYSDITMGDWGVNEHPWTNYGPSAELWVMFKYPYYFNVGCYFDGWHISLASRKDRHLAFSDKELIFGDPNKNQMWTTENEKVAEMMIECADKVMDNWEDMTK